MEYLPPRTQWDKTTTILLILYFLRVRNSLKALSLLPKVWGLNWDENHISGALPGLVQRLCLLTCAPTCSLLIVSSGQLNFLPGRLGLPRKVSSKSGKSAMAFYDLSSEVTLCLFLYTLFVKEATAYQIQVEGTQTHLLMGEEWKNLWPCFNMTTGGIDADETYSPTSYLSRSLSILKTRCLDINFSPLDHPNLSYPYILHS